MVLCDDHVRTFSELIQRLPNSFIGEVLQHLANNVEVSVR